MFMVPSNPVHSTVLWFTSSLSSVGMFQLTGGQKMWCPSLRRAGRRIQGTTGLSACPWCQKRSWSRLVTPCSTCRTIRGPHPATMGVQKAGCAQSTSSSSVTSSVDEGEAVDVVCLDLSKAFDAVSTAFSWRSWNDRGLDVCTRGC